MFTQDLTEQNHSFSIKLENGILLRTYEVSDSDVVFRLVDANRTYLAKWFPWVSSVKTPKDTENFIRTSIIAYQSKKSMCLGIWKKNDLLGQIAFNTIDLQKRYGEIGYWLAVEHSGKGVMTQACRELITIGFNELRLEKIAICCAEQNSKGQGIPLRLGFEDVARIDREVWQASTYNSNAFLYTMTDKKWENLQAKQPRILEKSFSQATQRIFLPQMSLHQAQSKSEPLHLISSKPRNVEPMPIKKNNNRFISLYNNFCKHKFAIVPLIIVAGGAYISYYCNNEQSKNSIA